MNPHLSVFKPYDRDASHEDQLTRAALIIMKHVPLAQVAFLELVGENDFSALPTPRFNMQTGRLLATSNFDEDGEIQITRLVSVFLSPKDQSPPADVDVNSTRQPRYDGVIQYGMDRIFVIESKLFEATSAWQSLKLNTEGIVLEDAEHRYVRWNDLLDRWWNLTELDVLAPVESSLLTDFFDYAETHFSWLLPFTDLARCGNHRQRRSRRLRSVLSEATGLEAAESERGACVKFPGKRVTSTQRVALEVCGDVLELRTWPAELKEQAEHLYKNPARVEALIRLLGQEGWVLRPNFHVSFFNAPGPARWYTDCTVSPEQYLRQWIEDAPEIGGCRRTKLEDPSFWDWLRQRGYASPEDRHGLKDLLDSNPTRQSFHIRPSIAVVKRWPMEEAKSLDKRGALCPAVRAAVDTVLGALEEPSLDQVAGFANSKNLGT